MTEITLLDFDDLEVKPKTEQKAERINPKCLKQISKVEYRKAFSETQLLDLMGIDFKGGESYHVISGGDIDFLSYLKVILRQQNLEYCLVSTWCIAMEDIREIETWLKTGKIKKMDMYLGEMFPTRSPKEYNELKRIMNDYGKIVVFWNHAKIFAGYGEKFYFAIESSANINTNPRVEQTTINIGKEIYNFYKDFYETQKGLKKYM